MARKLNLMEMNMMSIYALNEWYKDLQIREQQIANTKELIRRELESRVKS